MGRITATTGLFSGVPIQQTVDQLIALQARPRDLLTARNKTLEARQVGLTSVSGSLLKLQLALASFKSATVFDQRAATSNAENLTASITGSPAPGSYQFTAVRVAQSQQLISGGILSDTDPLGTGTLALRFGGFVDPDTKLDLLNGGQGLDRGQIRITDRSGATAVIDLRQAATVNDVLNAINSTVGVRVKAEVNGDGLRLTDLTGSTASNLRVEEVGGGTTARSLGLDGINAAAATASGRDVLRLFDNLKLSFLNDDLGVRLDDTLADLKVTLRDQTEVDVDFLKPGVAGTKPSGTTTGRNGTNSQLVFSTVEAGAKYAGVTVVFQNDPNITAGDEAVSYDEANKILLFRIDEGETTASQVSAALASDETLSKIFTASLTSGSDGVGKVSASDVATIEGPQATASLAGALGAKVTFTAVRRGAAYDGVTISFVDDPELAQGQESVVYDEEAKNLVFTISSGNTTADDLVRALSDDETASQFFTAAVSAGSVGTNKVDASDTATTSGGAPVEPSAGGNEQTLGQLLATINASAPGKLLARISADGDRVELVDLTTDAGGAFTVANLNGSRVADDLQLTADPVSNTITGARLLSGLNTTFLRTLNGGRGLGELGAVQITDRAGQTALLNLSGAATLDDVVRAVGGLGIGVSARINSSRTGIELYDTTGSTAHNLTVADADSTQTATKLGIVADAADTRFVGGNLGRQIVNEATLLSSLNGGRGIARGTFKIQDTQGATATIDLSGSQIQTLGDVIAEIKRAGIKVDARINDAGDGLLLFDTAINGAGHLKVTEGSSTTASDLNLLAAVKQIDIGGNQVDVIDATSTRYVTLDEDDTLADFVSKINALKIPVTAGYFSTGSNVTGFRVSLSSQVAGTQGELLLDTSALGFEFSEAVAAQDALLLVGPGGANGGGVLVSSSSNSFADVVPGLTINVSAASDDPATVEVARTSDDLKKALQSLADAYNEVRGKIAELTAVDPATGDGQALTGDNSLLRVDLDLSFAVSSRYRRAGSLGSLAEIGLALNNAGELEFDEERFADAYADDPEAIEELFRTESVGFVDRLEGVIEGLAADDNALLIGKLDSITRTLEANQARIEFLNAQLDSSRERLLDQFNRMEEAIAKLQSSQSALSAIQPIAPLGIGSLS